MNPVAATRPAPISLDLNTQSKISTFSFARLSLMAVVLFTTIFLRQEVLGETVVALIYCALGVSFFISLITVSLWEQTLRVRFFIPSQLLYDLLLTSYLVYLTGVTDSIFLFLYLLNIVFASVVYQLNGALLVSGVSGAIYAFIYYANIDSDINSPLSTLAYNELLFLLTALLCGQLMDELKRQKMQLESQQQSIERLELLNDRLLNSIPVGIVTVDEKEYVQNINQTALQLLGLSHAPSVRLKYYELLPDLKGILSAWKHMSETQRLRYFFKHSEKSQVQFSFNLVELKKSEPDQGLSPIYVLVIEDVSKLLELEKKLEFESRLAATGELAAGIAHEIRNPLASISGSIEMLSKNIHLESEQDSRLFAIALREIHRLNHLITDFLEFAKPKDESPDDFLLKELVHEVAEVLQNNSKKGFKISFSFEIPDRALVHANRERMKQVLINLFLNAAEATQEKSVNIAVRSSDGEDSQVRIDIIDDGPGIPATIAEKIFDPFFTTKVEGTGLGLATVARIIKAAKGDIFLLPSSKGAHFQLIVPAPTKLSETGT